MQNFQQQHGVPIFIRICVSSAVKGARVTRPPSYHRAKSRTTPSSSDGGGGGGGDERARETTTRTRPQATRDLFAPASDVFLSRKTLEVILFRQRCRRRLCCVAPCGYARDNCLGAQDKKCTAQQPRARPCGSTGRVPCIVNFYNQDLITA